MRAYNDDKVTGKNQSKNNRFQKPTNFFFYDCSPWPPQISDTYSKSYEN